VSRRIDRRLFRHRCVTGTEELGASRRHALGACAHERRRPPEHVERLLPHVTRAQARSRVYRDRGPGARRGRVNGKWGPSAIGYPCPAATTCTIRRSFGHTKPLVRIGELDTGTFPAEALIPIRPVSDPAGSAGARTLGPFQLGPTAACVSQSLKAAPWVFPNDYTLKGNAAGRRSSR